MAYLPGWVNRSAIKLRVYSADAVKLLAVGVRSDELLRRLVGGRQLIEEQRATEARRIEEIQNRRKHEHRRMGIDVRNRLFFVQLVLFQRNQRHPTNTLHEPNRGFNFSITNVSISQLSGSSIVEPCRLENRTGRSVDPNTS